MSPLSPEIWSRLASGRPHGQSLWARRAVPEITDRLLAALDADGHRHLLICLRDDEAHMNDGQSRGIRVSTRELVMPEHATGWYVDILCLDPSGHEAFQLVGGELAERLAATNKSAAESVALVLAKWRRFWGNQPREILSRQEQLGLFGELWFLRYWLAPHADIRDAVSRWRGPIGARHDFEWVGRSVEVKTTTCSRGLVHRINGIDQLVPPDSGDLLLFSLKLREEAGAGNTLPALVAECRQQMEGDDEVLSQFEARLARAGYSPAHEEEYEKTRLRIVDESIFTVRDDFPRITPHQFYDGLPDGIESVSYEINLSGFDRYRIPRLTWDADET